MADETLVMHKIPASRALVRTLDRQGDEPDLVAWCWFDADQEWRLLLAGPTFDLAEADDQPLEVLSRVAEALRQTKDSPISIADIKIVPTRSKWSGAIHALIKTVPGKFTHARMTSTRVADVFLDDVVVLRSVDREYLKQHPVPH